MSDTKKKRITIDVALDKDNIPGSILWHADDAPNEKPVACKAMMLSMWDHNQKDTLKLDLWTRDMTVDEMKIFFHQTLVSMSQTLMQSVADERIVGDMQDFCDYFAEKMEIKAD
jgi:gliding motility-associated protein GldC